MSPSLLAPARLRRPALALAALAVTASAAAGQGRAGVGAHPGQEPPGGACAGALVRPTPDSVTHTVALRVSALDAAQRVPASLTHLVAQGVAQYFVRPTSVAMLAARVVPASIC